MSDKHITEIVRIMDQTIDKNPGAQCFVKWTCPGCGERVTANEANVIYQGGYRHEDCGKVYTGEHFGLMVVLGNRSDPPDPDDAYERGDPKRSTFWPWGRR
jgi:hypothetical protein